MIQAKKTYALAVAMLWVQMAAAQPQIEVVGGAKLNLGSVYRGAVVEKKVVVKNTGNANLELGEVEVSCGCTGTLVAEKTVPPGKTTVLRITFNSKNFSGSVLKTVTVNSNAANMAHQRIEFTANIIDEILMSPQHIWFKDAEVGRTVKQTIKVTNQSDEPLKLLGSRSQLAGFTLSVPSTPIEPGKSVDIVAEFTAQTAIPIISDGMFITTNNPRQPEIYVPIFGNAKEFKFR